MFLELCFFPCRTPIFWLCEVLFQLLFFPFLLLFFKVMFNLQFKNNKTKSTQLLQIVYIYWIYYTMVVVNVSFSLFLKTKNKTTKKNLKILIERGKIVIERELQRAPYFFFWKSFFKWHKKNKRKVIWLLCFFIVGVGW